MTTEEIVKIIQILPEEKQQEVRDFAEFIARKDRRQRRSSIRQSADAARRTAMPRIDNIAHAAEGQTEETIFESNSRPIWETITELGQSIPAAE